MTGAEVQPGSNPIEIALLGSSQRNGYVLQSVGFKSVTGEELAGALALPSQPGKKPAVLLLHERADVDVTRTGGELDRLARSGNIVFAELPPALSGSRVSEIGAAGSVLIASAARGTDVGKTLVGLRIDDAIRCVDWLSTRQDVDSPEDFGLRFGSDGNCCFARRGAGYSHPRGHD